MQLSHVGSRLRAYRKKRRFEVTPEPPPQTPVATASHRFVVHKHDATRLHYDLRLEMGGVLVSWAIPKGPSFDPRVRRLGVQVEDHPIEYGEFEGRIPEGEYGAGDSLLWDRGTWRTEPPGEERAMMEKGHLVFVLEGKKLVGRWHLVRTGRRAGKSQWLFFKGRDEHASPDFDVVAERPESVVSGRRVTRGPVRRKTLEARHPPPIELLAKVWPPMFAQLSDAKTAARRASFFEVKYDGYRALAALSGGSLALQSRKGLDLSAQFPAIARGIAREVVAAEAVLDGEIVAIDDEGNARFQLLQRSGGELRYVAFDLLWLDGEDLRKRPLEERRELLESLLANADPPVMISERLPEPLDAALAEVRERGLEGLIAKTKGSRYRSGERTTDWAKVKVQLTQELAVIGFTPIATGQKAIGALLLGVREGKAYRHAGRAGTGFTDKQRRELFETLSRDVLETPPAGMPKMKNARWVKPRLVAQVAFREWTDDGILRQASFQGLRIDKEPGEAVKEEPAAAPQRTPAWRTRWTGEDWPST